MTNFLLPAILGVVALLYILMPLWAGASEQRLKPSDVVVYGVEELDLDHDLGKIDEDEWKARRPAIRSTPANDLYLVLDGFDTKDNSASIKAYMNPLVMWVWISQAFFILGTLVAFIPPRRAARIQARAEAAALQNAERERELVA